jgi:hypothetical protein
LPGSPEAFETSVETDSAGHKAVVYAGSPRDSAEEALLTGSLALDASGCYVVVDSTRDVAVVFPTETRLGNEAVLLPDQKSLIVGDSVAFGGGYREPSEDFNGCASSGEVFFIRTTEKTPADS